MMGRWTSWRCGLLVLPLLIGLQTPASADERYTVKSGDSLYKIARQYRVPLDTLKEVNHLEKDALKLNQVLIIPGKKEKPTSEPVKKALPEGTPYIVKKGDTLASLSKQAGISVEEIKRINQLTHPRLRVGQPLVLNIPLIVDPEPEEELGDDPGSPESSSEILSKESDGELDGSEKWKSPQERSLLVRVVKTFLGVPYRLGGSSLKGMDCSAFVKKIYEIFNIHLPRTTWEQCRIGKKIEKNELTEGDLVFFRIPARRVSNTHVGIYIGNNEFVHASSRKREVRVDNLDTPYFNKRFMNGVRLKELEREL
jgi:cell wall-associated NlpC family hydrolase